MTLVISKFQFNAVVIAVSVCHQLAYNAV